MKKALIIILSIVAILLVIGIGIFIYMKVTYLSENEVKEIVINDTGLNSNDIYFDNVELDMEDNAYDVDFYYNNVEYEYKIDAKNGRIIYNNFNIDNTSNQNNNNTNATNETNENTNNNSNITTTEITLDEAKNIALEHAQLNENDVTFTKTQMDTDDGKQVYDINFIYNNEEYDYEIAVSNGEVISYSKESIR